MGVQHHGNTHSASFDETVRLWGVDGSPGPVLQGHEDYVRSVTYRPDGQQLASCGWDKTVRLWGVDGSPGPVLQGHEGHVYSVTYRPDGQQLASAGDNTVRLWGVDGSPISVVSRQNARLGGILLWSRPRKNRLRVGDANFDHAQLDGNTRGVFNELKGKNLAESERPSEKKDRSKNSCLKTVIARSQVSLFQESSQTVGENEVVQDVSTVRNKKGCFSEMGVVIKRFMG